MSRLKGIKDWIVRGRSSRYDANVLARECGVSPGHLRRFFSEHLALSPQDWLNELRLWDAARLACERVPLKEIAFELKFGSTPHLCHAFKRYHRCAPSKFAELHANRVLKLKGLLDEPSFGGSNSAEPAPWLSAEHSLWTQVIIRAERKMHVSDNKSTH